MRKRKRILAQAHTEELIIKEEDVKLTLGLRVLMPSGSSASAVAISQVRFERMAGSCRMTA